ncbi:ISL3 family transposase [Candidatus Curtissbacteria bacterium]|nr:ISL3 family transposase [Candidatus Curtissbacteria bacterium]
MLCNQKVYLTFRKRRFLCAPCGKVFTERLPFVAPRARKSIYVQEHALERLTDSSFKATTRRLGFAYSTLTSLLKRVFSLASINWQDQVVGGKIRLGIDEHHFRKNRFVVTVANLLTGKPVHILPDDRKSTVVNFLKQLPQEVVNKIDEVAVDMKAAFVHAVSETLPAAKIVIDHFHVIQDANRRVNEARKIEDDVQEKIKGNGPRRINWRVLVTAKEHLRPNQEQLLAKYLSWYPAVSVFYACKESLRDMYQAPTKKIARQRLERLIVQMKHSDYPDLWIWARTLATYKEYILNYFDNHTTNAVTEGLHRKFKLIQRTAYGFRNPEVYVRKIMLACLPLTLLTIYPHN